MRNSKHWLRAIGLSIMAALGMMAFTAATAQALSSWLHGQSHAHELALNPEPLSSTGTNSAGLYLVELSAALATEVTVGGSQEGAGKLLVKGRNLTIECQKGEVAAGSKIVSSTDAVANVLFKECVAWNFAQTETLPCEVLGGGDPVGSVVTTALALPILHGPTGAKKNFVLFQPVAGETFVIVELHGKECPLPLENPVKGAISAEITQNHQVTVLGTFSPGIQLLTGDKLTFGAFPSYIDASATVTLTGGHSGKTLTVE